MKVLFSCPPTVGHIHPMLAMAHALQARGHNLLWAVGSDNVERIEGAGIRAVAAGLSHPGLLAAYRSRHSDLNSIRPQDRRRQALIKMFAGVAAEPMHADLLRLAESWRPDLLVHDPIEFGAAMVAERIGVPQVTHSFGAIIPTELVRLAGAELAELRARHGLKPDPLSGTYGDLYLDIYPPSMQLDDVANVRRRQLLRPQTSDVVGGTPIDRVATAGRPAVYLTFGTVNNRAPGFAAAVTAIGGLDVDLLVTVGDNGDPSSFGPQPANVRIERYVPQAVILEHCDLVVSHAGSGTLLAALERGIPQLCLPQAADQFLNAGATAAVGAGLALAPDQAEPAAMAEAASRLLREPSFRIAAGAIAREIAAMPDAAVAAERLEELVRI